MSGPGDGALFSQPTDTQIAVIAARAAMTIAGVIRLQPGLTHAVGRAARVMLTPASAAEQPADPGAVEVDRHPLQVTVRIVTGTTPTPRAVAVAVHHAVTTAVHLLTDQPATVIVVIVDVDADT